MAEDQVEVVAGLRRRLEEEYGVRAAAYLVERPSGGWESLVTKEHLDLRFDALRSELSGEVNSLRHELRASLEHELRALGWKVAGGLIAGLATFGAVIRF